MKLLRSWLSAGDPAIARVYHALFAICSLLAWLSLRAQLDVLMGSRGLMPASDLANDSALKALPFTELPTLVTRFSSDAALHTGVWIGAALSLLALAGALPRLTLALSTLLYLSYVVAGRTFFTFQWDNLLLECGLVAALLPRDRKAPFAHLALKILLFKLYWESGLAKWQSSLGDWQDGSAMTHYYQTAPLPGPLAHLAHSLPAWFHHVESRFTLFFELVLPFAIFGPRRARLSAALVFTVFQVVNVATANYGFFSYLSLALHVSLLDAKDLPRWLRGAPKARSRPALFEARRGAEVVALLAYAAASVVAGLGHFSKDPQVATVTAPVRVVLSRFRLVNTYHLFAAITTDRIEPTIEVSDGGGFIEMPLRHKPGDLHKRPGMVAPHQPRVDFQLWFYGITYNKRAMPPYAAALLDKVCHDPGAVQGLFAAKLPEAPVAVRYSFYRYRFTSREALAATGAYWTRVKMGEARTVVCR